MLLGGGTQFKVLSLQEPARPPRPGFAAEPEIKEHLAELYDSWGQPEEAAKWRAESIADSTLEPRN